MRGYGKSSCLHLGSRVDEELHALHPPSLACGVEGRAPIRGLVVHLGCMLQIRADRAEIQSRFRSRWDRDGLLGRAGHGGGERWS